VQDLGFKVPLHIKQVLLSFKGVWQHGKMIDRISKEKKKRKLIVFWLLSLICIPMLSFYGRGLQLNILLRFPEEKLSLGLGLIFFVLLIVSGTFLLKAGKNSAAYHLVWLIPLTFFLYASLPFCG